jgi:hypothetical protein
MCIFTSDNIAVPLYEMIIRQSETAYTTVNIYTGRYPIRQGG